MASGNADNRLPYWLLDLLQAISALVTIIAGIISILTIKNAPTAYSGFFWTVLVASIFFCLCFLLLTIKLASISKRRLKCFSEGFHNASTELINSYYDLLKAEKKGSITNDLIQQIAYRSLKNCMDALCNVLYEATGRKVSACIKMIELSDKMQFSRKAKAHKVKLTKENTYVRTYCRSTNSDPDRAIDDNTPKPITADSDFYGILFEGDQWFYKSDLRTYAKTQRKADKEYRNSRGSIFDKYYVGTMVVPLRIEASKLHYREDESFFIIGFLCLDSLSTNAFKENKDKDNYLYLARAFANQIFMFYERIEAFFIDKPPDKAKNESNNDLNANLEVVL